MDQIICAFLSHTHYWYEVGMLKVPALCTSNDYGDLISVEFITRSFAKKGTPPCFGAKKGHT